MRTGFYKGYKYEISEGLITMREIDRYTNTDKVSEVIDIIKELIGEIPNGTIVMLYVMRYSRWYNIYNHGSLGWNVAWRRSQNMIESLCDSNPYNK